MFLPETKPLVSCEGAVLRVRTRGLLLIHYAVAAAVECVMLRALSKLQQQLVPPRVSSSLGPHHAFSSRLLTFNQPAWNRVTVTRFTVN